MPSIPFSVASRAARRHPRIALLLAACATSVASVAVAQSERAAPVVNQGRAVEAGTGVESADTILLRATELPAAPPPPPLNSPRLGGTGRLQERVGFMMRGSLGAGFVSVHGGQKDSYRYPDMSGATIMGTGALAGALAPGVALGCEFVAHAFPSKADRTTGYTTSQFSAQYVTLGLSLDWMPKPDSGLIFGATVGNAGLRLEGVSSSDPYSGKAEMITGWMAAVRAGYLVPLNALWSLYVMPAGGVSNLAWDDAGTSAFWFALQAGLLYF
jgi:hypothetical protein